MRQSRAWDLNSVEHEPLDAFWLKEGLFWSVLIKNRRAFQLNQIGHVKLVYMDQAGHNSNSAAESRQSHRDGSSQYDFCYWDQIHKKHIYIYVYVYI